MVDPIWNFNLILENMFFSQCENSYDGGSIFIQSWSYKCYVSYLGIDPIFFEEKIEKSWMLLIRADYWDIEILAWQQGQSYLVGQRCLFGLG